MGTQNYEELINLYHNINVYCLVGALIFLAIAVALFFLLQIPKVFGELTGRTAQKAIEEMVAENAESGSLTSRKVGDDGRRRRKGKTGTLGGTGRLRKNTGRMSRKLAEDISGEISGGNPYTQPTEDMAQYNGNIPTEDMESYGGAPTDVLDSFGSQPTDVLDSYGSQPTDVLDSYGSQPTDVLDSFGSQPTDVLNSYETQNMGSDNTQDMYQTGPLYQAPESETMVLNQNVMNQNVGFKFVIERSIVEIHTDEVI